MNNYETSDNMVSHPPHYQSVNGLEVIDVIEAFTKSLSGIEAVDTANIIKYICRWKNKNGLQDLKKAMWYLQHLINHMETPDESEDTFTNFAPSIGATLDLKYFYFYERDAAWQTLKEMLRIARDYGHASVQDYLDILNNPHCILNSRRYGWTVKDLIEANVEDDQDLNTNMTKAYLHLPQPHILKEKENNNEN